MTIKERSEELRHQIGEFLEALAKDRHGFPFNGGYLPTELRRVQLQLSFLEDNPIAARAS